MSALKNIIPYMLYGALVLWAMHDPFFWDTVQLGSKHAQFYYSNDLSLQILPDEINSGHMPVFGYYLAMVWSIFGKSLVASHLSMLPFVFGIVYFLAKLARMRFMGPLLFLSILFLISDPTLVSQVGLISPDLPLVCFFLACLFFHHKRNKVFKAIFLLLLATVSMRGMFLVFAFFLFDGFIEKKNIKELFKTYLPAALVVFVFFLLHYLSKGWIAFHSDSPWSESFAIENISSILKKPLIIFWRLIDFNRWFIFLVTFIFAFKMFRADRKLYLITSELYLLGIISVIFGLVGTLFSGLTAHRYFLPINILVALYFLRMVSLSDLKLKSKKMVLISSVLILWLGHFLIYPPSIDQGWDASLAHKPYFNLRTQVDRYLTENGLSKEDVCTAFPDLAQGKYYNLDTSVHSFSRLSSNDCEYVLISNIHNDIEPADFENFIVLKEWYKWGVWYRLLRME